MRRLLAILLLACLPLPALAGAITGVMIEQGQGGIERLRFVTDSAITPTKVFPLSNPNRVVIDLPPSRATGIMLPADYRGRLIRAIRFGQFDAVTSRIVIDLNGPAQIVGNLTMPDQLLVDLKPFGNVPLTPGAAPTPPPQPLIIIDPGHGGQDPGALGLHGTREKNITLNFARALKEALLATGRYRVALTREDDRYILLPERVNIARKLKADIFISLHADSNPNADARGLSVYTLSETASDAEAEALADRENKSDIIAGLDLNTADEDVASILIDLAQRETMNKAALLAEKVVANLNPKITTPPNPHRFAGFRVLKAPDIPSILVETGFLSNRADETQLQSTQYQAQVAGSLVKALDAYMKE